MSFNGQCYSFFSISAITTAPIPMMIFSTACHSGSVPMSETPGRPAIPITRSKIPTIIKVNLQYFTVFTP